MKYISEFATSNANVLITAACSLIALVAYYHLSKLYNFWSSRGIKGDKPIFLFSDLKNIFFKNRVKQSVDLVRKYGKIHGIIFMGKPCLVIADPEVFRQICTKDFDSFPNHQISAWTNKYQRNFLVWLQDDQWKRTRAMMSPHFTSAKIKRMYKLLDACAEDLLENFREQLIFARRDHQRAALIDLFATYSLFTMDGITTCCYGLKLKRERGDLDIKRASARNALVRDCNQMVSFDWSRLLVYLLVPNPLLKAIGFTMVAESGLKSIVERVEKLIDDRRKGAGSSKFDDFLQMLIDAKLDDKMELNESDMAENHHACLTQESLQSDQEKLITCVESSENSNKLAKDDKLPAMVSEKSDGSGASSNKRVQHKALATKLNDLEILSEGLFLLFAGLDTTRSSLSTITYLLAHNQDVQERLYLELKNIAIHEDTPVGTNLKFDYDALTSCQYLDAVISESLRIFGPITYTDRTANRDYYIEKYDIHVPKGMTLMLGIHPVQNDPDYWDEPERFNPDRFMPGQREKIIPGSYAPFSMGPRHCIGMRFSLTETKLALAKVLMQYKFYPAPGTKYPPEPAFGISLVKVKNCKVLAIYRDEEF